MPFLNMQSSTKKTITVISNQGALFQICGNCRLNMNFYVQPAVEKASRIHRQRLFSFICNRGSLEAGIQPVMLRFKVTASILHPQPDTGSCP